MAAEREKWFSPGMSSDRLYNTKQSLLNIGTKEQLNGLSRDGGERERDRTPE